VKILVVTPLFARSGVALAQVRFARALQRRGHEVVLVVGHINREYGFDPPEDLTVRVLDAPNARGMFWPIVRYLREEQPEVVFSAEDHLNTFVLAAAILTGSKAKISGSCRVTPFDTYSNTPLTKRWLLKQFARLVMPRADALTCVSQDMVAQYRQVFSSPPHVCVYNIVDDATSRAKMAEPVDHPWLGDTSVPVVVAAGRLAPWKGFDTLIGAMDLLKERRTVRLMILGDGPLRAELQEQIDGLGLSDRVDLVGYVDNPLKYFREAQAFVLSSLVEGMPNVLVEAMLAGCSLVSTDCPTGPRELLREGRYGRLVPVGDAAAMAGAIEQALDDPIPADRLEEALAPFREETVIARHFELLGLAE
jgi:glycosyltransferase involved in cell wall biosynthesis